MGRGWMYRAKVKHLLTEKEDHASVQACMNAIADVLAEHHFFAGFRDKARFRQIPQGDDLVGPVDYANKLLERLYDYCDDRRIWLE